MPRRPAPSALRFSASVVALLGLAVCAVGCSESEPGTAARSIEIYGSVLSWVLDNEMPLPPEPADVDLEDGEEGEEVDEVDVPQVFVDKFGSQIDLQVQVELVSRFEEEGYDLRFLDTRSEALDDDEPGVPVRDGALLVGLGPIPEGSPVDVRAEIYRSLDDVDAYRFRLARFAGTWGFLEQPAPVEPEGFVADP